MIIGILALSMLTGLIAAGFALVSGASILVALAIYAFTGMFGVLGFAMMRVLPRRERGALPVST